MFPFRSQKNFSSHSLSLSLSFSLSLPSFLCTEYRQTDKGREKNTHEEEEEEESQYDARACVCVCSCSFSSFLSYVLSSYSFYCIRDFFCYRRNIERERETHVVEDGKDLSVGDRIERA